MLKFVSGLFAGWLVLLMAGFLFLQLGGMPVRTKGPALPMEGWIAHTALHAAMRDELDRPSPIPSDEANLAAGAHLYIKECADCHGLPNHKKSAMAAGLFPRPPQLFEHGVDDDPVGATFWKVKYGIRLTGMPGFEDSYSEKELWQVSLFLAKGDILPQTVKDLLTHSEVK
jgi:mono/diheme cytochrome c family protein